MMDDENILKDLIVLAKLGSKGPLGFAQGATAEKLYQEILRRMAYKVDPHEVSIRMYHLRHAERRIGEIGLNIAGLDKHIGQEYDDLVHEVSRLEHEITELLTGVKK